MIEGFEVVGTNDQRNSNEGIRLVAPPGFAGGDIVIRGCRVHDHGNRVHCFTVDEREDIELMLELGVDVIISNNPARVRRVLASRSAGGPA